jgi:putative ABC transport system substrate-binding protein
MPICFDRGWVLGWVEHKNLVLDMRFTHGDGARFAPLTAEMLALRPDVFVAPFDTMAIPAAASTATVPIVFAVRIDPVRLSIWRKHGAASAWCLSSSS